MNSTNTVGFAGCPSHLEVWRRQAARQAADDRFTVLFTELVAAARRTDASPEDEYLNGVYMGLARAYALLTGDTEDYVHELVARTTREPVTS